MLTFLKANIASLVASLFDYLITICAVHFFKADVVVAGMTGTISGGIINFLMGRHWAFKAAQHSSQEQAARYLLVWTGNLLLNASGMYFFTKFTLIHYIVAKLVTSLLVAIGYNYPLQKKYVFKNN